MRQSVSAIGLGPTLPAPNNDGYVNNPENGLVIATNEEADVRTGRNEAPGSRQSDGT